ncbi:MAG: nucleoside-diphosphate kinase [Promethearchaeota archaeon]
MGLTRTFVMIKPDGVRRNLVGKIIGRFEEAGIKLITMQMLSVSRKMAEKHYAEHEGKEFYKRLLNFITSGPSIAMVLEGSNVVPEVRKMVGATNPAEAESGTIRGDFREEPLKSTTENMIHASDSDQSANREIKLFFGKNYLL